MLRGQHRFRTFGAGDGFFGKYRTRNPDLGGRIRPWRGLGRAPMREARPGGYARQECGALGVGKPVLDEPQTSWASHQTRLGQAIKQGGPVLRGRWAILASQLGEPVLRGRWASQLLQWPSQWPTSAPAWRSYGPARHQVPARHTCLARLEKQLGGTCHLCLLGTVHVPARHCKCPLVSARSACTVPACTFTHRSAHFSWVPACPASHRKDPRTAA